MATYSPNLTEKTADNTPTHSGNEEEILNLRPLITVLLHWWREILLVTALAVILGTGLVFYQRSLTPPSYSATAQVAIVRIVSNVNLDSTFQTNMNDVTSSQENTARRTSLLGLVTNGSIAEAVYQELGPLVANSTPTALMRKVSASFQGDDPSDLIQISAVADTPEKAAAIANAWAKYYVSHINTMYGEMPTEMAELVESELVAAKDNYEMAQDAYEEFLSLNDSATITRQLAEKQKVIDTLQAGRAAGLSTIMTRTLNYRQDVIKTYVEAVQRNRLLALTSEQNANRQLVQSLIQAIGDNRQLAFTTDQNARVQLFTQYAERELQNRLLALQQEQDAKTQLFRAYSDADLRAKLTVFNQQADSKVGALVSLYIAQQRIEQLLAEATALQTQIEQAGAAGARTNSVPLLMLKIEAYAATPTAAATNMLQLDLSENGTLETDVENQARDIAALIDTLTARTAELDERIAQESQALYNNEGYALLDGTRPEDDALFAAIQQQYLALFEVDDLAETGASVSEESVLSQAILAKYDELFGVGALAAASLNISNTLPIYSALEAQYPALFTVGDLTELGDMLASDSALDTASQQKLLELLQPVDELESYLAALEESSQPILRVEEEIRALQTALEERRAEEERLLMNRDLMLETYTALNNKLLELTLQRTAGGREVRLAAIANPPDYAIAGPSLALIGFIAGLAGFILAVIIAFLASYMDAPPFLSRLRLPQHRPASQAS